MTFEEFNEKWGYGEIVRKAFETPGGAQRFLYSTLPISFCHSSPNQN